MPNLIFIFVPTKQNNNDLKIEIMSKYYTKLSDGSFREDNLLWHLTSTNAPWNICDLIVAIVSFGLIAFALIYGLCFAERPPHVI